MTHQIADELQFCIDEQIPEVEEMNVFNSAQTKIAGNLFNFYIIGSSHYICSDDFHEVFSCKEVKTNPESDGMVETFPLGEEDFNTGPRWHGENTVYWVSSSSESGPVFTNEQSDLFYSFGPGAYTGIRFREGGYSTMHSYPEYDQIVYTVTVFTDDF